MNAHISNSHKTTKRIKDKLINTDIFKRAKIVSELKLRKSKVNTIHCQKTQKKNLYLNNMLLFKNNVPLKHKNRKAFSQNSKDTMSLPNIKKQKCFSPNHSNYKLKSRNSYISFSNNINSSNNIKCYDTGDKIDYTAKSNRITTLKNIEMFLHRETTIKNIRFSKHRENNKELTLVGKLFSFSN